MAQLTSISVKNKTPTFNSIFVANRDLRDWYIVVYNMRNFGGWPTMESDMIVKSIDSKHSCLSTGGIMKSIQVVRQEEPFRLKVPVGDTCCRFYSERNLKGKSREYCVDEGDFNYIVPGIPTG